MSIDPPPIDAAVWHHVWATVILAETLEHMERAGHHEIAGLIRQHLERQTAMRDAAVEEARELNAHYSDNT